MELLRKFLEKRHPHVIAIAGENMDAYYLKKDIEAMISSFFSRSDNFDTAVEIVDNEAAKIYMHSKQAMVRIYSYCLKNTKQNVVISS